MEFIARIKKKKKKKIYIIDVTSSKSLHIDDFTCQLVDILEAAYFNWMYFVILLC